MSRSGSGAPTRITSYNVCYTKLLRCHEELAQTGVFLEYDTICRHKYHDDEKEIMLIMHMVNKGHLQRLLLSLDTTRSRLISYGGTVGLDYILVHFTNQLQAKGMDVSMIHTIMSENAQRALALNNF